MATVSIGTPSVAPIKTPTPRDSMPFTTTKGLLNGPGQNNCFLNSAVQVLWHLDIFRRSFRDVTGHACMAESCIFCALKELFSQLQFSNETALPPDALRRALAESFFDQQRFQLGFMDDAAECFENILMRIHSHIAQGISEDMCNVRQCIPHQKFAMTLVEQSICGACDATSEPLSFTQMVHYVSASALTMQFRQNSINGRSQSSSDSFGELLRQAGSMGDIRDCPSSCGAKIQICRTLMNRPEIVSVGIVWDSERPTLEHIMDVFATVGTTLKLADLFHKVVDNRWAEITAHNLVGVVTYYGKHYSTFFFHTKFRVWIYFDDATVREIGPRWEQVIEKCRRGRHQPLLLLYAVPNGTPVTLDNAQLITEKNKNEALLRRSVTPSPEKPIIGNTRRAITPNPDGQKPRMYNEYQNLSVIQDNIYGRSLSSVDVVDGDLSNYRKPTTIQRTLSNGSSSGVESFNTPDHHPTTTRRRDSGNWSGDRNSASSASSTTMENPYLYLIGRVPSVPGSPTRKTDHTGNALFDQGYDSYSLSSNDSSSMSTIQHLMKMGHLAKIPEDYNHRISDKQNCDGLCTEADELLKKSRHFEDEHDLVLALALCNAAATKARAAMNAPYNNPQTLTLARMKYNTCIMRARSLHRRMTQAQGITTKEVQQPEIRHTREGSSGSGKHSRQNSRDKTHHSRQNSRELLVPSTPQIEKSSPQKTIEIYATLPKKKDLKNKVINIEEDSEYVLYDKPPTRESRSLFSKSKNKDTKVKEKRSRSEDRNKLSKDFSIAPDILLNGKDTLKKKEDKEEKKDKDKNKKQHKIRRKLLMGGLIRRKNRSMPDLTEANDDSAKEKPIASSIDDSSIGIKNENINSMCGYLSEGHLEFSGTGTNPTLERSKLMRKSYHGSAGKVLTAAKVPPPPPLRTTSQLSNAKMNEVDGQKFPDNNFYNQYHHIETIEAYPQYASEVASLPYVPQNNCHHQRSGSSDILIYLTRDAAMMNTVVTQAEVHQVQSPAKHDGNFYHTPQQEDPGVDEVDCLPPMPASLQNFDLPPYPSPASSVVHSRQPSEEFPPPPPPLDLSALEEHLPEASSKPTPSTLLSQLQNKRLEILSQDEKPVQETAKSSGDTWLRELQAKQAALRQKKAANLDAITVQKDQNDATKNAKSSVRDLASRFENITETQPNTVEENHDYGQFLQYRDSKADNTVQTGVLSLKKREDEVTCEEMQLQRSNSDGEDKKSRIKKKSVSFCDQVILVATAEEQEDDSYIPNPILERVLRTAMNKPEAAAIRQEILMRQNKGKGQNEQEKSARTGNQPEPAQPVYIRQNSVDNLINRQNQPEPVHYRTQASNPQVQRQSPYHMMHGYTPNGQNLIANGQNLITNGQNYTGNGQNFIGNQNSVDNLINRQSLPEPVYVRQNSVDNLLNKQSQEYNNFEYRNQASNSQVQRQSPYHMMHGYTPNGQNFVSNGQNYEENAQNLITNGQNLIPNGQNLIANGQNSIGNGQNSIGNGQNSIGNGQNSIGNGQNFAGSPNYIQNNNQIYVQNGQRYPLYGNDGFPGRSGYPNGQTQQESVQNQCSSSPRNIYPHPQELGMQNHGQRSPYNQNLNVPVRPASYNHQGSPNYHPAYQHPPSPSPSTQSYTTQSSYQGSPVTQYNQQYQRVPPIHDYPGQNVFPKQEQTSQNMYQRNDLVQNSPYQRVPDPNYQYQRLQQPKIPQQTQNLKKTVSFEPGTKGGAESPTPKAVVTPIIVNNNVAYNSTKPKCNLCRKKNVLAPSLYCGDCEFYMSRFKPKT